MRVCGAAILLIALTGCSDDSVQPQANVSKKSAPSVDATPVTASASLQEETFAIEDPQYKPRNIELVKNINANLDAAFERLAIKLRVRDPRGFEALLSSDFRARQLPGTAPPTIVGRTAFIDQWESTFADWRRIRDVDLHIDSRRLGDGTSGVAQIRLSVNGMSATGDDVNYSAQARVRTTGNLLNDWTLDRWEWQGAQTETKSHGFKVHHHDMGLHPLDSHENRESTDGGGYAALIVGDVDGDGAFDLFAPGPSHSPLYIRRDTKFEDEAWQRGLRAESGGTGGVFADLDGDGQDDLLVTKLGHTEIDGTTRGAAMRAYTNRAGHFESGFKSLEHFHPSFVAIPFDLGLDGDLDVFVGGYGIDRGPHSATASSGAKDELFENDGTGKFRDVASEFGIAATGWCRSAAVLDHDSDGDLDLYVANERSDDRLWSQENGERRFTNLSYRRSWAKSKRLDCALSIDDADGDGALDLFSDLCNGQIAGCGLGTLPLTGPRFEEGLVRSAELDSGRLWSVVTGDWNLDGHTDAMTIGRGLSDHRTEHT